MIDFGKYNVSELPKDLLQIHEKSCKSKEHFYWREILFKPVFGNGNDVFISKYTADIRGLRVSLRENKLVISNSLHKFFHGNNHSDFTRSELIQSIDLLSDILGVKSTLITPAIIEFGINEKISDVDNYLNSISNYKGKQIGVMRNKSSEYGRKLEMEQVYIKAYDKTKETWFHYKRRLTIENSNLLRVEIGLIGKKQLSFIPNLSALTNIDTLKILQKKLLYYFELIQLNENFNLNNISNRDLELLHAGKSPFFWKEYKKVNYESSKKRKQQYKKICSDKRIEGVREEVIEKIKEKTEYLIEN